MTTFKFSIASPCTQSWAGMQGDDRVRHCGACQKNVFNFKEMSNAEIESLLRETEGRVCARLYQRKDGSVLTRDCPVALAGIRRRLVAGAMAAGAMVLGLFTVLPRNAHAAPGGLTLGERSAQLERKLRRAPVVGPVIEKIDPQINVVAGGMRPPMDPPKPVITPIVQPVKLTKESTPKFGLTVGNR